ncbi:sigma-70 family RNA polymerase sigma factor [Planctomycetota bacterium]
MHSQPRQNEPQNPTEQYVKLLLENQRRIYYFILHLVPNISDADDLMQETATLMWRKFDTYQLGTDFYHWGIRIAFNVVRNFRRSMANSKLIFDDQLLELLESETPVLPHDVDRRIETLRLCLRKLPEQDRCILRFHHEMGMSTKQLAEKLGSSLSTTYRRLRRIYALLMRCVRLNLADQEML